MALQYTPYTVPLAVAVVVSAISAALAWYHREGPVEFYGIWLHVELVLWPLCLLLALSVTSPSLKQWFLLLFVPTVPLLVVSSLLFVVHFTGRGEWDTPRHRRLLALLPVSAFALSVTNGLHGLVLRNPRLDTGGPFVQLTYSWGPGMDAIVAVSAAIVGVYLTLMVRKLLGSRNVYRNLTFVFLLGFASVTAAFLLSFTGLSPFPHFVLGPLVYVVVGVLVVVGTTSARFLRQLPVDEVLSLASARFDSGVPLARDFVVQEVDNGIVVLDGEDRIVDINRTAKRMLGLDRPVGKHFLEVTRPEWVLEGDELLTMLAEEQPVRELEDEVWVRTADGERCYDVTISALTDDGDDATAHVVLMHDVTRRKERAERLEEQKEQLQFQTRQLERQNERLDRFAGIVSHDLRNPLNVVDGNLELLRSKTPNEDGEVSISLEKVDRLTQATERMETIIDDALTLARQGKAITETETVALGDVVADAWSNVATADATLESSVDATIVADRDRLLNVFENLFRNCVEHGSTSSRPAADDAVEHGSTGNQNPADAADGDGVTVRVGLLANRDGFFVADDGPGIPDDEKGQVFDHGYTTSSEGTGLGLAIVSDIVYAHGWSTEVTDSEDGGARFEISDVRVRPEATPESTPVVEDES